MIKTFEQFTYNIFEEENVIFQILNDNLYNFIKEEYGFKYYHRKNKPSIEIPLSISKKLMNIENEIELYLKEKINPFEGKFENRKFKYEIKPTEHWYEKFFRKELEPYLNIKENPNLLEGINLIYNNKNLMTKYLSVGTFNNQMKILIKTKDSSLYSEIIKIESIGKNTYNIFLISQIKGLQFNIKADKIALFHPKNQDMVQ